MLGTIFWSSWTSGWTASSFLLLSAAPTVGANGFLLIAPDHGAQAERFRRIQIRDGELGLERAHLAGLIFAREEAQRIGSGRERQHGIVLQISLRPIAAASASFSFTVMLSRTPADQFARKHRGSGR